MKFLGNLHTNDGDTYEMFKGHTRSEVGVTVEEMQKIIMAVVAEVTRSQWPFREQLEPGSAHLTVSGRFQSDKYPWCAAGFVPLKTSDPMAQDLLREYAKRRAAVDKDFCADLLAALPHDEPA